MIVGFLSNQLDNRGTGNALYDYADLNEKYLGNKSKIFTFSTGTHSPKMVEKFRERFGTIHDVGAIRTSKMDVLYHIKSGEYDNFGQNIPDNITYAVHAVFNSQPHGDRYAVVSKWMSLRDDQPFVPHLVHNGQYPKNYRDVLEIPKDAFVFGRHGGYDTFDIPWAWDEIKSLLDENENVWFLFANTEGKIEHPRIVYMPEFFEDTDRARFINTCNAMIHARFRGETFGLSIAEFSVQNKPVLTYLNSHEKAHLLELEKVPHFGYSDQKSLAAQLRLVIKNLPHNSRAYTEYTSISKVMDKFKEVFLDYEDQSEAWDYAT